MSNECAIEINNVSKSYIIYPSSKHLIMEAFGLYKLFPKAKKIFNTFDALKSINISIQKGERLGIIGRNGAGKSTLLKLITGNFKPTVGSIQVNGTVQAMLQTGLGFHEDLSGRDNIRASLLFNNLSSKEVTSAEVDIIEFCELGEFIDYPIKTYSLGMLARLQFACATAVHPDILIVDEVLGAGDGYFSGKSAYRMEKLTNSGCTLLLVSHSMAQILQFCENAIWIENGEIVASGKSLDVVKAYEAYINRLSHHEKHHHCKETSKQQLQLMLRSILGNINLVDNALSQWVGSHGLKIDKIHLLDKNAVRKDVFFTLDPFTICFEYHAESSNEYNFTAVVVIFSEEGKVITRFISSIQSVNLEQNEHKFIELYCESLLLGNGNYILSVALYKKLDLKNQTESEPYDLLSRCLKFSVISDDRLDPSIVYMPATWRSKEEIKQYDYMS